MTKQLEQELTAWMRQQADQAPHDTDLEPGAYRKSRRIRVQRRITSAVVVAAVLGLAVPAGMHAMNLAAGPARPQVANSPTTIETPRQTPQPQPAPVPASPVQINFDQLPHGVTTLPWWSSSDRAIHDGGTVYTEVEAPKELAKLGDRQFAVVTDPGRTGLESLELIGVRDPATVAVKGSYSLALSPDGSQLAWVSNDPKGFSSVNIASTETGKLVDQLGLGDRSDLSVVGFSGNDVLISSDRGASKPEARLWNRTHGKPEVVQLRGASYAVASARNGQAISILTHLEDDKSGNGRWCGAVIRDIKRRLWESCDLMAVAISPDGRYALTQPSNTEGAGTGSFTVVDLLTGKKGLEIRAELLNQFAWEADSRHFVVEALNEGKTALVRSDLYGNLELISDPVTYSFPEDDQPYVLGSR
jgi:WD40-like Beta Propeller Repeat